ncbi:S-methyl-5'-thioadenosine phosphorylase [Prosthecobacter sp. SYSU 5D2]|uniref:S-methyl-5'-thioadenosine phosphorylase n=1 Tax=Prosthecobacter sp. SYSU 5D2 TaxID=3134134 RepID=UPI0031FF3CAB
MTDTSTPAIGIIGGSGLYDFDGFEGRQELEVITPYGTPSDKIVSGTYAGRRVYFLPRHAKGHRILPTELNHRANLWALRSLNVRWIIAVTAVGSLKEEYRPRDIVLPDQFYDRTSRREHHTFFGRGLVAHIAFADPISANLRNLLAEEATAAGATVHNGGTYVNMDGPAFSTRAESNANRQLGFDVIGMTNLPEAKLAREAEISLATLAMITDYDCWKTDEAHVTADAVMAHVSANAAMAKAVIAKVIPRIPLQPNWPEHRALDGALMTDRKLWPAKIVQSLKPILERFI